MYAFSAVKMDKTEHDADLSLLIGNIVLACLVLVEQYLGISKCKSNCLVQLLVNNLRWKQCTDDEPEKTSLPKKENGPIVEAGGGASDSVGPTADLAKAA